MGQRSVFAPAHELRNDGLTDSNESVIVNSHHVDRRCIMYEKLDVSVLNYMFESYGYHFPCDGDDKRANFISDDMVPDAAEYEEYECRLKEWS